MNTPHNTPDSNSSSEAEKRRAEAGRIRVRNTGVVPRESPLDAELEKWAAAQHRVVEEAAKLQAFRAELERRRNRERDMPELFTPAPERIMTSEEAALQIEVAEGFVRLELFADAWGTLESLPEQFRHSPEARRVRLAIFTILELWQEGEGLLDAFSVLSPQDQRETAGRFLLARAVFLLAEGNRPLARERIARLSRLWPEGREHIVNHPLLSQLW